MTPAPYACDLAAVRAAAERIRGFVHRTPVLTSETLDRAAGRRVFLKCENLQKVGAFKYRGATNAVRRLSDAEAARGDEGRGRGVRRAGHAMRADPRRPRGGRGAARGQDRGRPDPAIRPPGRD